MSVLLVFIIHAWINPGTKPSPIGFIGYYSIDCFFVLSAFLITSLLVREKAQYGDIAYGNFLARRGLRIWPFFLVTIAFSCFILPLFNLSAALRQYPEFFVKQVLPCAFFYFNFTYPFASGQLNAYSAYIGIPIAAALVPYWTLCMEEHFYTVWPYVVKKAKSISALVAVLCVLEIATIAARCILNFVTMNFLSLDVPFQLYYMNTLCHLDPLVIGGLLAFAYHKRPSAFELNNRVGLALSAVLGLILTYLITQMYHHFPTSDPTMVVDMTINSVAAGLSFYLAMAWRPVRNLFALKTAGILGRYCFAFYLVHNFVFALVEQQLVRLPLPEIQYSYFTLKCLIGFPVTFAIALLSWKYIESPFHRLKKNFERKAVNPA